MHSFAAAWLFLDETLAKKKKDSTPSDSQDGDSDPPNETNSSENSHCNDSGVELLQSWSTNDPSSAEDSSSHDTLLLSEQDEERKEEEMQQFELDDTDSEYDATSDTELIRSRRNKSHSAFTKKIHESCRKCLQTFSFVKLAQKVLQRLTDCVGGFFTCVLCLWSYDYTKCKPQNVKKRSSGWGKVVTVGSWRTFKLILDRKVSLSVLLYGFIAFLAIVSNEVWLV